MQYVVVLGQPEMIKVSWEWEIDGRKVSPNRVADEIARGVLKQAKDGVQKRIAGVRCPVHRTSPSDIQASKAEGKLSFTYRTCCDKLRDAVEASFRLRVGSTRCGDRCA